jgi:hypothetical protein
MFLLHIPLVAILIVFWIFNGATLLVCAMTSHIFFIYIRPYLFYGRKRSVKLTNDKIEFLQDGHLIDSINLCEKFEIYKTFDDYYHKSQKYKGIQEKLRKWLLPIALISVLQIFKFVKWLFYLVKTKSSYYKSDDAVIIFQEDKVLNVLATSRFERALIKKYFLDRLKIDIDELEFYKELGHNYESIKIGE